MLEATQRIDRYILCERLGRDAVTETWKGFDPHLQRDIVLRLLLRSPRSQPDLVARFLQEARAMAVLQHPDIVQVYDVAELASEDAGDVAGYMVTPCVQGGTLADYIARTSSVGKFPSATQMVQLFTAISGAIDYAHRQGAIHGDIAPGNILLDERIDERSPAPGLPVLTNFGLARLCNACAGSEHDISIVIGSPLYVAPELARGAAPTRQSDLYALGMILYELCAGKHPFASLEQRPLTLLFQKIMSEPMPPSRLNPAITPALEAVILRGIANDPDRRFPNARAMAHSLARALSVPLTQMVAVEYYAISAAPEPEPAPVKVADKGAKAAGKAMPSRLASVPERRTAEKDRGRAGGEGPPAGQERIFAALPSRLKAPWFVSLCVTSILVIAELLFLISGGGQLLPRGLATGTVALGQAHFMSSGQGDISQGQGINDEVRIDLTRLPEPGEGKAYFAWLQGDLNRSDSPFVLLGRLNVAQGAAHLTYADPRHTDLLATMSRVLVTQEDADSLPIVPSPDRTAWKYAGAISQTPNPGDQQHYSLLDHLRHLLATDPELEALGLHDGLAFWFYQNSGLIQQYAQETRGSFDAGDGLWLNRELVSLLDYLDGINDVGRDVGAGTPVFVDATSARVGLLQLRADQNPPGYLYHIGLHLSGLLASPGATIDQRRIATSIVQALDTVSTLLEQMHSIARQLVALPPSQLLQGKVKAQLTTLAQLATAAYMGQGPGRAGIRQVYTQLAVLALIPITAYQAA